jgi:UDP-glucuronate 4-epimerase
MRYAELVNAVVTGAAGFIGSHITEQLVRDGFRVTAVDSFDSSLYSAEEKHTNAESLPVTVTPFDLTNGDVAALVHDADLVFNLAAIPGLMLSWRDFETYVRSNLVAVERLARACADTGRARIIHASTSSVYGAAAIGDESLATQPTSPYGVSKLAGEQILRAYHENFALPVTILRYFSIYGPRQRPDMAYRRFIEALLRDEEITVYGDGSQSRTNTFVADCVAATVRAAELADPFAVMNIAGSSELRLLDAIQLLGEIVGTTPRVRFENRRPGDQTETKGDTTLARTALDFHPRTSPREGLELEVEWIKARANT